MVSHRSVELEQTSDAARRTLQQRAEMGPDQGDRARDAFQSEIENIVLDLVRVVPDGVADLDVRDLLERLVHLNRANVEDREKDALRLAVEMDDIIRRIRARAAHDWLETPDAAMTFVLGALGGVDAKRMAAVLGVSAKTVSNWRKGADIRAANADRVRLVGRCAFALRRTMTATGLALWFERVVPQLGDRSPIQTMDDGLPAAWESLSAFVAGSRA